jgi:hypothetical protein
LVPAHGRRREAAPGDLSKLAAILPAASMIFT